MSIRNTAEKANVESIYPLGPAQRGMLYYSVVHPDETAYLEQLRTTLEGELRTDALRRAWELVVARHQALRSQFVWEHRDQPLQVVRREVELPWIEHDLGDLPEAEAEARIEELLAEDRSRGLSLDRAPLLRLAVVRRAGGRWEVIWTFHHILIDGWSIGLVQSEVWTAYRALVRGEEPELPPAPSLRAWIAWLGRRDDDTDRDFWRRAVHGLEEPFETGLPGGEVAEGESDQGEVRTALPAEEVERLTLFARHHGLTFNAVAVGAWALLLQRYTGRSHVAFGTVAAGRPPELPDVERTVGVFMNALPAWTEVPAGARVADWLVTLQERLVEIRDHAGRSLEEIQEWAGLPVREPLFDTLFVFENYPSDPAAIRDLEGVRITGQRMRERGAFPVSLYLTPRGDELVVWLDYRRGRLDDPAAERLMRHYLTLLKALSERPEARLSELPMLSGEERSRLLTEWAEGGPLPEGAGERPVHRRFAERAKEAPGAEAVIDGDRRWSYGELAARAGAVATRLRELGVGTDDRVALLADRSAEMLAGLLGILGTGAGYVPIDPKTPADRIAFVLADAGVEALVTHGAAAVPESGLPRLALEELADLAESDPEALLDAPAEPESTAYVVYTSGSTGRPKGVVVSHRSLDSYVATAAAAQGIEAGTRVLQFASIGFDTSAEEIWPCLTRGGTLVLRDDRALGGPEELGSALREWRPEVLDLPTAFWHEMAAAVAAGELELPESLRLVILGGEKALGLALADWRRGLGERAGAIRVDNTYGPTETTIVATSATLSAADAEAAGEADPPIGRAVAGARAYVLGPDLRVLPYGVAGELVIGGAGVARGYLGRPALTAEKFVPDPSGLVTGGRLYRTGDLASFSPSAMLEFRGRIDDQVKIRGFRVEPGEVAAVLASHPDLRDAAVTPWIAPGRSDGGERRDLRLAAYVVSQGGREVPRPAALRDFVAERLPEYMVPSVFMGLHEIPRTASGKLDRRALPEPEGMLEDRSAFVSPRTPVEELLAGWWSEMLGLERVSRDDDFFRLGGHSLLVGRLAARVRKELGVDLPMIEVFEHPVLADLAARIDAAETGGDAGPPPPPPLRVTDRSRPLPLSYQQERVWFLNNLVPDTTAYNFQIRFWLRGELDVGVLERALTEIVRRQEVFRTTFPEVEGVPAQVVHPAWRVELPVTDLSHLEREEAERRAEEILEEEVESPFDVTALPLIRWRLLKIGEGDHQLIQVEHHFVHDGWSISVVLTELKALYKAFLADEPSPLPELAFQYGDFSVWQRDWLRDEAMEQISTYWRRKITGVPTRLDLPADRPRPSRMTLKGDAIREFLPTEIYRGLRAFGRREGFTLYMTMMAAFQALVHRYTGEETFLIGTGIANRRVVELEPIVGMMVNSLVIRGDLDGDPTFRDLLERVRTTTLEAYAHQDMPFERLVEETRPERDASRNPLFQVMFSFHDAAMPDLDFEDLRMGFLVEHNHTAKTDLNVIIAPRAEQRVGRVAHAKDDRAMITWEFSTDLFDKDRIERLIRHYYTLVTAALENPDLRVSELPLMPPEEEALVTRAWTGERTQYPRDAGVAELFRRQAAARPTAEALSWTDEGGGTGSMTYGELAAEANRWAHRLIEHGARRGEPVAIVLDRSPETIVAILAVLSTGAFYVPIDPAYPVERMVYLLEDSGTRLIVTREAHQGRLADLLAGPGEAPPVVYLDDPAERAAVAELPSAPPAVEVTGDDLSQLLYTSGSTGRPKGVAIPQRGLARLVLGTDYAPFGPDQTCFHLASVAFDASSFQVWCALLNGARLVIFPPGPPSAEEIGTAIQSEEPRFLFLTTGLHNQLVEDQIEEIAPLEHLLSGAETASPVHFRAVIEAHPHMAISNVYGPSENTAFSTVYTYSEAEGVGPDGRPAWMTDEGSPVPVGSPIANCTAYVTDRWGRPVPIGIVGELLVGGDGLSRGYWGKPRLTAERFVPDPFSDEPGARTYRTGDLARWLRDGDIDFLGRNDGQLKVRGFRVEPGEIEMALTEHPDVYEAAITFPTLRGEKTLVAYVSGPGTAAGAEAADLPGRLRDYLRGRLPHYMVPQVFVPLERLPRTVHDKVDRRALPEPGLVAAAAVEHVEPRNPAERAMAAIWADLLHIDGVGVRDDFFQLGGHSLIATRIMARVRREFGADVPLAVLFEEPTVEELVRAVEAAGGTPPPADEELSDDDLDTMLGRMLTEQER
jgi:amino acid adenylation domain-containing protein